MEKENLVISDFEKQESESTDLFKESKEKLDTLIESQDDDKKQLQKVERNEHTIFDDPLPDATQVRMREGQINALSNINS